MLRFDRFEKSYNGYGSSFIAKNEVIIKFRGAGFIRLNYIHVTYSRLTYK